MCLRSKEGDEHDLGIVHQSSPTILVGELCAYHCRSDRGIAICSVHVGDFSKVFKLE